MSEIKTYVGKLIPVYTEEIEEEIISRKLDIESDKPTALDICEKFWEDYIILGDILYRKEDVEIEGDIQSFRPDGNGGFDYIMQFYNGATCLDECLEEGFNKLNTKDADRSYK